MDRSVVFARWHQCATPSNTCFLGPMSLSPKWHLNSFIRFMRKLHFFDLFAFVVQLNVQQEISQHTHTQPFNGPFSGTTQVSRYQKGKTNLDFTEARETEWQWHQMDLLQTDNHAITPPLSFLQTRCPSCRTTNSVKALKAKSFTTNQSNGICTSSCNSTHSARCGLQLQML